MQLAVSVAAWLSMGAAVRVAVGAVVGAGGVVERERVRMAVGAVVGAAIRLVAVDAAAG
jgi:hypothetical protein